MTVVQLTAQGAPAYPVKVNSEHVASLRPLRKVKPTQNTQTPGAVHTVFEGTEILLSSGQRHNVMEDYAEVDNALFGLQEVVTEYPNDPEGIISEDQIPSLRAPQEFSDLNLRDEEEDVEFIKGLKEAGVPVSDNSFSPVIEEAEESPAGTPLTEEELESAAKHDAIPEDERSPEPGVLSPAEKRKRTLEAKKAAKESGDE